jgi:hypothetical protein
MCRSVARFEGKTEPLALKHMGADPAKHAALILNRVSAANFIALTTLLRKSDRVFAFAPAGRRIASLDRAGRSRWPRDLREFHSYVELKKAWDGGAPRLLLINAASAHRSATFRLPSSAGARAAARSGDARVRRRCAHGFADRVLRRAAYFPGRRGSIWRCAPQTSTSRCPRAGVLVGREDLVTLIG